MRYKILLIIHLFMAHHASAQWQTIFKDSVNHWCTNVQFLNNDTGFVSAAWLTSSAENGIVFRTKDGGQTWDTSTFMPVIYAVHFVNDTMGFAGGQDGAIYRTDNMGDTWNWIGGGPCCSDLFSLHFFNADTGFYAMSTNAIVKTVNGGPSWQPVFLSIGWTSYPGRSRFFFTDSLTGYVTQHTITKTDDRGMTWFNLNLPSGFLACSAHFFDSNSGVAVGYEGKVTRTMDGGATWSTPDSLGPFPLTDISFVNDSIGYIVGGFDNFNYSNTNGIIFKTINGGATWQVMDSSYFDGLLKLHFPSESVGYAVGINGITLKITNANTTGLEDDEEEPHVTEFGIFPNPVTSTLYVSVSPTEEIFITDMFGNRVMNNSFVADSDGQIELNVTSLASGIYIVRTSSQARKFVKY